MWGFQGIPQVQGSVPPPDTPATLWALSQQRGSPQGSAASSVSRSTASSTRVPGSGITMHHGEDLSLHLLSHNFSPPAQSTQSFILLKADKGIDKSIECSSSVLPTFCSPVLEVRHRQLSLWIMASFSLTCLVLSFLYFHLIWKNRGSNYSLMKLSWVYTDCFSCQDSICSLFHLDLHLTPPGS